MGLKNIFNEVSYYAAKTKDVVSDIGHGLNFTTGYGPQRLWKGINAAFTGYCGLQLAFGIAAVGAAAVISGPALFTGIGLAVAYGYGRREYR
jgi:hypothetical protein